MSVIERGRLEPKPAGHLGRHADLEPLEAMVARVGYIEVEEIRHASRAQRADARLEHPAADSQSARRVELAVIIAVRAELVNVAAVLVKHLDTVVARVGDVDPAVRPHGHVLGAVELAVAVTVLPEVLIRELGHRVAVGLVLPHRDAVIPRVGHVEALVGIQFIIYVRVEAADDLDVVHHPAVGIRGIGRHAHHHHEPTQLDNRVGVV